MTHLSVDGSKWRSCFNLRCACVFSAVYLQQGSQRLHRRSPLTAQRGWRSAVISYDDLIPGDAFNVKEVEDEVDIPRSQTVLYQTESCLYQCRLLRTVNAQLGCFCAGIQSKSALLHYTACKSTAIRQHFTRGIKNGVSFHINAS